MKSPTLELLLDKARKACLPKSYYQLARRLNVTRGAVSQWKNGAKVSPSTLAKIIQIGQQDPALAIQVMQEQHATPEEQRLWSAIWEQTVPGHYGDRKS